MAKEGIKDGLNAKEALNGAKELLAATGDNSLTRAFESAHVFKEAGLTKAEIALNEAEVAAKKAAQQAELQEKLAKKKEELMEKFGDKLLENQAARAEAQRIAQETEALNKLLEQ